MYMSMQCTYVTLHPACRACGAIMPRTRTHTPPTSGRLTSPHPYVGAASFLCMSHDAQARCYVYATISGWLTLGASMKNVHTNKNPNTHTTPHTDTR
jgi:hypothetical protein